MRAVFHLGLIEITVALVEVPNWNDAPHDEIRTTVSAVIEGQHVTYSVSEMVSPFAGWEGIEAQFNRACAEYAFINRKEKETNQ